MSELDPVGDPGLGSASFVHQHGGPQCSGGSHHGSCPSPPGQETCAPQGDGTFICTHILGPGEPGP